MSMDADAYAAVKAGDAKKLARVLQTKPRVNVNARNTNDFTMLHVACSKGYDACTRVLLENKANVNANAKPDIVTPLHVAASGGHVKCMDYLFKYQARVDSPDSRDVTPLHAAAAGGSMEAVDLLLTRGANIRARDYKKRTPLDVAIGYKNPEVADLLRSVQEAEDGASGGGGAPGPADIDISKSEADEWGRAWVVKKSVGEGSEAGSWEEMKEGAADPELPADAGEVLEKELAQIIGLANVKSMLRSVYKKVSVDQRRKKFGFTPEHNLNMLFLGNPGTGKTSVARVVAKLFKHLGVLKKGQLIEVSRKDLVAEYSGQSAQRTLAKCKEAIGGVLFVDEAYGLKHQDSKDSFGQEVVDTLVAEMENHRHEMVCIMAGYTKEMTAFMASNSGLASRFPVTLEFENYSHEEMAEIFTSMVEAKRLTIDPAIDKAKLTQLMQTLVPKSVAAKGNARAVRNIVDNVLRIQTDRVADSGTQSMASLMTLRLEDFQAVSSAGGADATADAMSKLDAVVGVENVKKFVRRLRAQITIANEKRALGMPVAQQGTLHMIFQGNPGTGKTTIARLVGDMLKDLGVLSKGQLVECTRSDLVGEHVGETGPKTLLLVERAIGGVLFVDEAYTLVQDAKDSFGREALDTLMKAMEDNRDELLCILAGYPENMTKLLAANPGLKSRFPFVIDFPDYDAQELMMIAEGMVKSMQMKLAPCGYERLMVMCENNAADPDPQGGNARFVRNVLEAASMHQAERLCAMDSRSAEDLVLLLGVDFDAH